MGVDAGELTDAAELTGLAPGATELLVGGTAPAVEDGPGFAMGEASAATAGVAPGVGEAIVAAGKVPSFTLSLRLLVELLLCA